MLNAARPLCFSWHHEGIAMRRAMAKPRWICFRTLPIWGLNASSAARSALWIDFVRKSTTQPFSRILVPRHGSSQCSSQRGFPAGGPRELQTALQQRIRHTRLFSDIPRKGLTRSHHNVRTATQEGTGGGMHDKVPIRILLYLSRRLRGDKLTRALSYKAELPSYGALGSATMLVALEGAGSQRTLCSRFAWSNFLARRRLPPKQPISFRSRSLEVRVTWQQSRSLV